MNADRPARAGTHAGAGVVVEVVVDGDVVVVGPEVVAAVVAVTARTGDT
jgi:hypothetical protein